MFSEISWTDYVEVVLFMLAVYYGVVLIKYYRKDFIFFLLKKHKAPIAAFATATLKEQKPKANNVGYNATTYAQDSSDQFGLLVQSLVDELKAFLSEAGENGLLKEQMWHSLKLLLGKYSSLEGSPFKESIQHFIIDECQRICSVHFSEIEIEGLWK